MGAFKPPVKNAGDKCYITDHVDIGMGINAASPNKEAAKTFVAVGRLARVRRALRQRAAGLRAARQAPRSSSRTRWRRSSSAGASECEATIRLPYQIISRGTPNLWNEMWVVSANVVNGTQTPEDAAAQLQKGLAAWYAPQQK